MCSELYGKESDYVDWRHFLVCAAQPWSLPHPHQLLVTLERFTEAGGEEGRVGRRQFMAVRMWLDGEEGGEEGGEEEGEREGEQTKQEEGEVFNRVEKLKQFLFELFSDKDEKVDYINMVYRLWPMTCMEQW